MGPVPIPPSWPLVVGGDVYMVRVVCSLMLAMSSALAGGIRGKPHPAEPWKSLGKTLSGGKLEKCTQVF